MISGLVMHLAVLAQSCECPLWRLQILAELNGWRSRPFFMAKWTAESQLFAVRKAPVWMMDACRWEPWLDTETGLSPIATLATLATLSSSSSGASTDRLIQGNTGKEGPLGKRNR